MKSKPGVWFATAEEIAKYIKQQSGLAGTAGSGDEEDAMRHTSVVVATSASCLAVRRRGGAAAARPDNQPGRKWTEAQLREASSHVRAGRVAQPEGLAERRARRRRAHLQRQQLGQPARARRHRRRRDDRRRVRRRAGAARACSSCSIAHDVPATFFVAGGRRSRRPADGAGDRQAQAPRDRRARLERRERRGARTTPPRSRGC